MDKIKIDNELPKLGIQTTGELPLISVDEESRRAYRTLHMIEEAQQKKQNFRFWLTLIVSNLISVASLIVAILAYIKK